MRKQLTIGIPKAFLYYRYNILWTTFFKNLGCKIILSPDTNKTTLEIGKKYSIDESCLPNKIYLGHIASLQNKCDYIFVPRIADYGKNEKVCIKFNGIYDTVKTLFPNTKLLDCNIEVTKKRTELISYTLLGLKITKNLPKVIYTYLKSYHAQKKYNQHQIATQHQKLSSNKLKVLIVSHPYNTYDKYIGEPIINFLKELQVELIYADILDRKTSKKYAKELSPTLYWIYSKELIGAIGYYQHYIDGIIFLTTFPCGPDSLVNELMIRKIDNIPITNILIDESNAEVGIQTRLESFIDIIKERRKNID